MASHCILWLGFAWCRFGCAWCNDAMHANSLDEVWCWARHFGFAFSLVLVLIVYPEILHCMPAWLMHFGIMVHCFMLGPPFFFFGGHVCFSLRLRGFVLGLLILWEEQLSSIICLFKLYSSWLLLGLSSSRHGGSQASLFDRLMLSLHGCAVSAWLLGFVQISC